MGATPGFTVVTWSAGVAGWDGAAVAVLLSSSSALDVCFVSSSGVTASDADAVAAVVSVDVTLTAVVNDVVSTVPSDIK